MFPSIYDIFAAVHREMELRKWMESVIKGSNDTKLDIAIKGLEKIKRIAKAKKLGVVYKTAERTLAKTGEKK
jgi:hypothetical protein